MNNKKLLERQRYIKASAIPIRAVVSSFSRRETPSISITQEEETTSFFDFEDDLADLKSSAEQIKEFSEPFVVLEERVQTQPIIEMEEIELEPSPIEMEEEIFIPQVFQQEEIKQSVEQILEKYEIEFHIDKEEQVKQEPSNTQELPFEFIQCSYVKENGDRCKRQAPKGKDICSSHAKLLKKLTS